MRLGGLRSSRPNEDFGAKASAPAPLAGSCTCTWPLRSPTAPSHPGGWEKLAPGCKGANGAYNYSDFGVCEHEGARAEGPCSRPSARSEARGGSAPQAACAAVSGERNQLRPAARGQAARRSGLNEWEAINNSGEGARGNKKQALKVKVLSSALAGTPGLPYRPRLAHAPPGASLSPAPPGLAGSTCVFLLSPPHATSAPGPSPARPRGP